LSGGGGGGVSSLLLHEVKIEPSTKLQINVAFINLNRKIVCVMIILF
jgi:hypothetical protein